MKKKKQRQLKAYRYAIIVLVILLSGSNAIAQLPEKLNRNESIPLDPAVRVGKLANGLTYYIRKNSQPENKIEMRLVVKGGRFNEDDDQVELAHLTEHMAFEGTKHFPGDSMISYTAKEGLHFGNDFNAFTGGLNTGYELTIPAGKPELFKNCMKILRDWAQEFTFDSHHIDSQRGVVGSEIRQRGGYDFSAIMSADLNHKLLNNPIYSYESTRRSAQNLQQFKPESLLRFYRDWYRPGLEAVIVVGNVDADAVEAAIKATFADLKNPEHPRQVEEAFTSRMAGKLSGKPQTFHITNKEKSGIEIQVYQKRKGKIDYIKTIGDQESDIMAELFNSMASARFAGLTRRYNAPFSSAYSRIDNGLYQSFSQLDGLVTTIRMDNATAVTLALKTVMTEVERIRRYGFTAEELDKAKKAYLVTDQTLKRESSISMTRNYIDHFTYGAAAPAPGYARELINRLLKETTLEAINAYAKKWAGIETERDVFILAPEKNKATLPTEKEVAKCLADIKKAPLQPFKKAAPLPDSLMYTRDLPPLPSNVFFTESKMQDTSMLRLQLSNGAKVILRKLDKAAAAQRAASIMTRRSGDIDLVGYSDGGTSLYTGADSIAAACASGIVYNGGIGNFNKFQLDEFLRDRKLRLSQYLDGNAERISGSCSAAELETMFQMLYLYFTAPRKDEEAFKDWIATQKTSIINDEQNIDKQFDKVVLSARGIKNGLTVEQLESVKQDNVYRIYKERYSGVQDFTFVITGDFDYEKMKQLIFKYVVSLPKGNGKDNRAEEKTWLPSGKISKNMYLGQNDNKADVVLYFPGSATYNYSTRNNLILDILGKSLNFMIMDRLRTKEGGVYTPHGGSMYTRVSKDKGTYGFMVSFDCMPGNTDNMIRCSQEEFRALMEKGPDSNTFYKALGETRRSVQQRLSTGIGAMQLMELYRYNEYPSDYAGQEKVLDAVTWEETIAFAKQYLTDENFQRFAKFPESFKNKANTSQQSTGKKGF